jgi:hypothetical protein
VDPKPSHGLLLAPPHSGTAAAARLPGRNAPPPLDEHVVKPEVTRDELIRGRRVVAMPALPPHADRQAELGYVIRGNLRPGYIGASELLTRVSEGSDFATDYCVRKAGTDASSGARSLEELSFEVVNEQSARDIREKVEDLTARGVRRVIAVFVKTGKVSEWSPSTAAWKDLDRDATIEDPCLSRPLRVQALLDAAAADDAVARALLAKDVPALVEARKASEQRGREDGLAEGEKKGLAEGEKKGLRQGVEAACELLGIELGPDRRARLGALDGAGLEALLAHLRAERRWP